MGHAGTILAKNNKANSRAFSLKKFDNVEHPFCGTPLGFKNLWCITRGCYHEVVITPGQSSQFIEPQRGSTLGEWAPVKSFQREHTEANRLMIVYCYSILAVSEPCPFFQRFQRFQ